MEEIIDTLKNSKVTLTKEDLRQVGNKLTFISLATDKMIEERNNIYKLIKEIKDILDSYIENE